MATSPIVERDGGQLETRVRTWLADAARNGPVYVKSKHIADDLDETSQRVAQAIVWLREHAATLEVEAWTSKNANGTTWRVEATGPTPFGRDCPGCGSLVADDARECPHCGAEVGR